MYPRTHVSHVLTVILVAVLLSVSALVCTSCGSGGGQQFSKDIQDQLSKAVDAKMAEYGVPGAIVYVSAPGKGEWTALKGKANIETGEAPKQDDHVRIASITKTFTSTVILQLADEKKLSLDDTISKFDLGVTVPNSDKITIRNLLNMTSGLYNYTDDQENFWNKFLPDPTKPWKPEQLVEIANAHGAVAEPGQGYQYNNTNYVLLGMIIEKLTGESAGEAITSRIIDKLKLKNTSLPTTSEMPKAYMSGYMPSIEPPVDVGGPAIKDITVETPTAFFTAGGMVSDLADIKIWLKALSDGELLSPEMHKEQLAFAPPNTASYGLGVMNATPLIGHSGEITGYNSAAYTRPVTNDVTVIVFLNRYRSKVEGVSDQFLGEVVRVLEPLFTTSTSK
jgi:D-alanyl-D-alanine carboxypeptidase